MFDYQYYLEHINDKSSEEYHARKIKGLADLFNRVMNESLTEKQREVVDLVKIQGLTGKEAAEFLGVNPSTVSRHLAAAQRKFDDAFMCFACAR